MNTRYMNLYLKPNGEMICGDPYTKRETAEREGWGNYVKVATVEVQLTDAQLDLIQNS